VPVIAWQCCTFDELSSERYTPERGRYHLVLGRDSLTESILDGKVQAAINHDPRGRYLAQQDDTLRLRRDAQGLWAYATLPEFGNPGLLNRIRKRQAAGSVGIEISRERWERDGQGRLLRIVTQADLGEVSLLLGRSPAFAATSGSAYIVDENLHAPAIRRN